MIWAASAASLSAVFRYTSVRQFGALALAQGARCASQKSQEFLVLSWASWMLTSGEPCRRNFSICPRTRESDLSEFGFLPALARPAPCAANPHAGPKPVVTHRLTRLQSARVPRNLSHCRRILLYFLQHPSRLRADRTTSPQLLPREVPHSVTAIQADGFAPRSL
jgi:hypothetical protein